MDWQVEMAEQLIHSEVRDRKKVISLYQRLTGKSTPTLYRIARRNGFHGRTKKRSDTGVCCLSDDQIMYVMGLIHTSSRQKKGIIMDVETALDIAEKNDVIHPGTISVSRLTSILREKGVRKMGRQAPHIRMKSKHPNHIHVFDSSICIQYYLRNGKAGLMDERDFNIKKPKNLEKVSKKRIIRCNIVDHYSGYVYLKYYNAASENKEITYDFITSAWRGMPGMCFHGVPSGILMDAGAFNVAKSMLEFFSNLGIEIPASLPHNARRQGVSEGMHNIIERKFESRLAFNPAWDIDQLNQWALNWCRWFNEKKKHSRHQKTRGQKWREIKKEELRELPSEEVLQAIFREPIQTRKVDGAYGINFKFPHIRARQQYNLKELDVNPGDVVRVRLHPYWAPDLCVIVDDQEYRVSPIEIDDNGFPVDAPVILEEYAGVPDNPRLRQKKEIERAAYGADLHKARKDQTPYHGQVKSFEFDETEDYEAPEGVEIPIHTAIIDDMRPVEAEEEEVITPVIISRPEVEADVASEEEAAACYYPEKEDVPVIALLKAISDRTGEPISSELNAEIRKEFGDTVSQSDMDLYLYLHYSD